MTKRLPDFDVALSFAGEDRDYVQRVADALDRMGLRVFYDKHELVTLWGKDLYTHLREVYCNRARCTVIFISKSYKRKLWPNHERASAQARAFRERREYILPARFDNTRIPGLLETTGYVNLRRVSPNELAAMVREKLGPIERPGYFPQSLDRLWHEMKATTTAQRDRSHAVASRLFRAMKLMTAREREIFGTAVLHSCREKLPANVHVELGLLERLTRATRDEIVAVFARLECLGITSRIPRARRHGNELGLTEQLEISYYSTLKVPDGYDTRLMSNVFRCIEETYCPECIRLAVRRLDWSVLSSETAGPTVHRRKRKQPEAG